MKELKSIETACGRLIYILTESENEFESCYGIIIRCKLFGEEESASVDDISCDKEKTEQFMKLLADNNVLPCTLKDIAEDYLTAECTV